MKKIRKIFITVLFAFSLVGCAKMNTGLEINEEGNLVYSIDFLYNEKEMLEKVEQGAKDYIKELFVEFYKVKDGQDYFDMPLEEAYQELMNDKYFIEDLEDVLESLTTASLFREFEEEASYMGDSENVTVKKSSETINGEKWDRFIVTVIIPKKYTETILTKNGDQWVLSLSKEELEDLTFVDIYEDFIDYLFEELDFAIDDLGYVLDKEDFCKLFDDIDFERTLTITMPDKAESNIGKTKGNTVTIDLTEINSNLKVSAQPSSSNNFLYIGIAVIGIVIIGGGVFAINNKKKKRTN